MTRAVVAASRVIPGFGMTLGVTVTYVGLVVLLPLVAVAVHAWQLSVADFWRVVTAPRVIAAYQLSFGAALFSASVSVAFGLLVAWVLVRYEFVGRQFLDALVDLPFALPTAVAGISLAAIYAPNGWIGALLQPLGWRVAFTPAGIVVALVFIGFPFVVRTTQPVLAALAKEPEEAATTLGASRWQIFQRVIFPSLIPALLTGFSLAFARAVGEYGSVIFIAGNLPFVSEIVPLVIVTKLEQFDQAGATAVAVTMLMMAFLILLGIHGIQWHLRRTRQTK